MVRDKGYMRSLIGTDLQNMSHYHVFVIFCEHL